MIKTVDITSGQTRRSSLRVCYCCFRSFIPQSHNEQVFCSSKCFSKTRSKVIIPNRFKDLLGQRFGILTVTNQTDKRNSRGSVIWVCKCDCGETKEYSINTLRSNKSCGCLGRHNARKRPFEWIYNSLLRDAKSVNRKVTICYEDYVDLIKNPNCFYCGIEINFQPFCRSINTSYSLDRKDNQKDYTAENVVICCKKCNFGKGNLFSFEEWVVVGKALQEHRRELAK